ncbi:diguanylate cyclase domain-containing protein [Rhizobium sp. 21-4511-3d]
MNLWHALLPNLAIIAIATSVWMLSRRHVVRIGVRATDLAFGLVMGAGVLGTMAIPVEYLPGVFLDARYTLLAVSAYFGGPLSALFPLAAAILRRLAIGGAGVPVAIPQILAASLGGLLLRRIMRGRIDSFSPMIVVSCWAAVCGVVGFYVRYPASFWGEVSATTVPLAIIIFGATLLSGLAIVQEFKRQAATHENSLYRSVIEALPDCLNAKDRDGRFIVANPATAELMGTTVQRLVGRTDSDFYGRQTGDLFRLPELEVLNTGGPVTVEQRFVRTDGAETWLSTLKAPLRDEDGVIVGVVTHNREITERKRLEQELQASQARLRDAIESMAEGLAMFDAEGVLVFHNDRFKTLFPLTADVRAPGECIRTIVRASLERGEQQRPANDLEGVVERTADVLMKAGERAIRLADGRTIDARTSRTGDGGAIIVFSDVTVHREREERLRELNERLASLASTDGLTGLTNRRTFDAALAAAAGRGVTSLLMVDVDHFKAFNDGYGHPEGDQCLKNVAASLSEVFSGVRGAVVARYGGEEFAVILPGIPSDQACAMGMLATASVRALGLPHLFSEKKVVTVSVGVSTHAAGDAAWLLRAADTALYAAKAAGRDCVRDHGEARRRPAQTSVQAR